METTRFALVFPLLVASSITVACASEQTAAGEEPVTEHDLTSANGSCALDPRNAIPRSSLFDEQGHERGGADYPLSAPVPENCQKALCERGTKGSQEHGNWSSLRKRCSCDSKNAIQRMSGDKVIYCESDPRY